MYELFWLLLPVAALSGWMIGRRSNSRAPDEVPDYRMDYFKGLNYLLNEESDKALEVFVRLLEVDSETVEFHMALGSLFRRKGDVERSIRVHQNLIARPTLERGQRSQALMALGKDYMYAGLFDRAENLFDELRSDRLLSSEALQQLLAIYQQEKEWNKAIAIAEKLQRATGKNMRVQIAQFYCELANAANKKQDQKQAIRSVKKALSVDLNCVRASIILGDIETSKQNFQSAIRAYRRVEQQDLDYLPEVLSAMKVCSENAGGLDEFKEYLQSVMEKSHGVDVMLQISQIIERETSEFDASSYVGAELKRNPSIRGLIRLIELSIDRSQGSARENLGLLLELLRKVLDERPLYQCQECGFSGRSLHWQCPSCKNWSSIKPSADFVWS